MLPVPIEGVVLINIVESSKIECTISMIISIVSFIICLVGIVFVAIKMDFGAFSVKADFIVLFTLALVASIIACYYSIRSFVNLSDDVLYSVAILPNINVGKFVQYYDIVDVENGTYTVKLKNYPGTDNTQAILDYLKNQ